MSEEGEAWAATWPAASANSQPGRRAQSPTILNNKFQRYIVFICSQIVIIGCRWVYLKNDDDDCLLTYGMI